MTENDNEIINSTNDTEETVDDEQIEVELDENESVDDVETLKKKVATLEAQKEHWRNKAKKVNTETPVEKKDTATPNLSVKDQLALLKANVEPEDIDEVIEYANYKKISIADALKSSVVKNIISEKEEYRKSAKAAGTNTKRPSAKATDEALIQNASKGTLPESDDDIQRLWLARKGVRG